MKEVLFYGHIDFLLAYKSRQAFDKKMQVKLIIFLIVGTGVVDNDPNPQVDRAFSKKIPRVGSAPSVKKINGTAIPS